MKQILFAFGAVAIAAITISATAQPAPQEAERRAAITVLRAINTAENAILQKTGKYLPLTELIDQPMMSRVKPDIAISGSTYAHAGAQVRLALSADATQYVVTVVSGAPNHTAAFTDERGLIYTGQALQ